MFKVKIYTIGKIKEPWLKEAVFEYEKRLTQRMEVQWILAKNEQEFSQTLSSKISWIALDIKGDLIDSPTVAKKMLQTSRLHFVIGGPNGIPETLLAKSIWKWSLSPLTLTHQIVRLLLIEQLYRAIEITQESAYHR